MGLPVDSLMLLYYFVRNSLVALLEALFVECFSQLRQYQFFPDIFAFFSYFLYVCKAFVFNNSLSSAPLNQALLCLVVAITLVG